MQCVIRRKKRLRIYKSGYPVGEDTCYFSFFVRSIKKADIDKQQGKPVDFDR